MKWATKLIGLLFVTMLCGCASEQKRRDAFFEPKTKTAAKPKQPPKPPFAMDVAENEIVEAVVRRFAQDASSELKAPVRTVCLGFTPNRLDPGPEFVKRLSGAAFRVVPVSAASELPETSQPAGSRAVTLVIQRLNWVDFTNVEVPCVWSADASRELHFSYQLVRRGGRWSVK